MSIIIFIVINVVMRLKISNIFGIVKCVNMIYVKSVVLNLIQFNYMFLIFKKLKANALSFML